MLKFTVDNLDMSGACDYTAWLDAEHPPKIVRKLNQAWTLEAHLVCDNTVSICVRAGARVVLESDTGEIWFTGYTMSVPQRVFAGKGAHGDVIRLLLHATGDELALDRQALPTRAPLMNRTADDAIATLVADTGVPIDTTQLSAPGLITTYAESADERWSHAAEALANQSRAALTVQNGVAKTTPIGAAQHFINDDDENFYPSELNARELSPVANDLTITGELEPQMYVKDYFVANGTNQRFYLSNTPFLRGGDVLLDEEYSGTLSPQYWSVNDPAGALTVSSGKLQVVGRNTTDGSAALSWAEQVELGGSWLLEHGAVQVSQVPAGSGVLGGIYNGAVGKANCLAGFAVNGSLIQALVNGANTGSTISLVVGHRYELKTRLFSREVYRQSQKYCSSEATGANAYGGTQTPADLWVLLEVRDINPSDPTTFTAPGTVLYDGMLANVPAFATYALVNAGDMKCSIAYTRVTRTAEALVRSTPPISTYPTFTYRLGPSSEGGQCEIVSGSNELYFYTQSIPGNGELIEVTYRSSGRASARVVDANAAAALACVGDNGIRSAVQTVKSPVARTSEDCMNAALALLDDLAEPGWEGAYEAWRSYLPGHTQDIWPGDALVVNASELAQCSVVVREVEVSFAALREDLAQLKITFANESAQPICVKTSRALQKQVPSVITTQCGANANVPSLAAAEFETITAAQLTINTGTAPVSGGGFEVRTEGDFGWSATSDRNLVGRYTTQTFTLPKTSATQDYYLRMYDGATPPNYSRYSTLLHVDANL